MANVYKWSTIDRIVNAVITTGGNIALARLLTLDDFGLLGMVAIFWAIAYNISSCGMSDGLIRKLNPTAQDYSTVFTFNALSGLVFCAMFILGGPLIADFFNQPALIGIMTAIGICFVFQTMWIIQETRMRKRLEMKKIAMVRIAASISAVGLGIVLAATGWGYWGLVSCRIFLSVFLFIYYLIASRWMPRPGIWRKSFKEMFGFGINLMMAYLASQITVYINQFILGRYSSRDSGLFSQAQKMEDTPFRMIEAIFNWPFFAVVSNVKRIGERRRLVRQMLSTIALVSVTVGFILMLLASPGVKFLFGDKWSESIPIFRILVLFGIGSTFKYYFQTILKLHGKSDRIRQLTFIELGLQLGLLAIVFHWGILWIAWTQVAGLVAVLGIYVYHFCRLQHERFSSFLRLMFEPLAIPTIAFVVTAIGYLAWDNLLPNLLNCLTSMLLFASVSIMLWERYPNDYYVKIRAKVLAKLPFVKLVPEGDNPDEDY